MRLSYVIISYNRCETLRQTLTLLPSRTPLANGDWDIWVIDNASTDGTATMMRNDFPHVHFHRLEKNIGMPARNAGFDRASGEYIICLDDDSYPADANAVGEMIGYLDREPAVAAVVARVELPDGTPEAPAFPSVLLGGATCFRAAVLKEVGGFSPEFFRQAEEYELSFRIWQAGYHIERFEDIIFRHDKVSGPGRASELVHRMDVRNNLIVAERFLPQPLRTIYRDDWAQRYSAIAWHAGHGEAARKGRVQARVAAFKEWSRGRRLLSESATEQVFQFRAQAEHVSFWACRHHVRNVCVADFSKNLFATFNACSWAGVNVSAIIDDNPAFTAMTYRGVKILPASAINATAIDGVILSNINPAQIDRRMDSLRSRFAGPILRLWEGKRISDHQEANRIAA